MLSTKNTQTGGLPLKPGDRRLLEAELSRRADATQQMMIDHLNRLFPPGKVDPSGPQAPAD